jgi:plastocyanin
MRWMAGLAAACVLALAGCGGSDSSGSSGSSTLNIAADPGGAIKFTQSDLTAKAGKVTIAFTNKSKVPHAVEIEGNGLDEVKTKVVTGADASVTADLKPGKYTFYCPVDGHRAAGMKGTITVS